MGDDLKVVLAGITILGCLSFQSNFVWSGSSVSNARQNWDVAPVICGVSRVSVAKSTVVYTWRVEGLLDYLEYVQTFDQTFIHETKAVRFDMGQGPGLNDSWSFKIQALKRPFEEQVQTYIYADFKYAETELNKRLNIGMDLQISVSNPTQNASVSPAYRFSIKKPSRNYLEKVRLHVPKAEPKAEEKRVLSSSWFTIGPDSGEQNDFLTPDLDTSSSSSGASGPETTLVSLAFDSPNIQPRLVEMAELWNNRTRFGARALDVEIEFNIFYFLPNEASIRDPARCSKYDTKVTIEVPQKAEQNKIDTKANTETVTVTLPPFAQNMEKAFQNGLYSDLRIRVEGHEFPVHRVIVGNTSPKLGSLLETTNSSILELVFEDKELKPSKAELDQTLRFIYTGLVNLTGESYGSGAQMLRLATSLGIEPLKSVYADFLLSQLTVQNAIFIYSLSKDTAVPALTEAALDTIKRNKQVIVSQSEEFHKLTAKFPNLMFDLFMSS